MDDSTIEIEGSSESEAAQRACDALNTRMENLGYEILEESKGKRSKLMGFMRSGSGKKVRIRAWRKDARGEAALGPVSTLAKETLNEIVGHMCEDYTIQAIEQSDTITMEVEGDEGGLLIGKNGSTLDAMQYILRKVVARSFPDNEKKLIVNTEGYRERRRDSLIATAKRLAKKVRSSNRRETLRPMNAFDRRIVHMALKDEPGVSTKSQGEGSDRSVVICPTDRRGRGGRGRRDANSGNHKKSASNDLPR